MAGSDSEAAGAAGKFQAAAPEAGGGDSTETEGHTVMLRHIACKYTQEDVRDILDSLGLEGKFDFVYIPKSVSRNSNLGYAFVNFKSKEYVEECRQLCEGKPFGPSATHKLCQVVPAHMQGGIKAAMFTKGWRIRIKKKAEPLVIGDASSSSAGARSSAAAASAPSAAAAAADPADLGGAVASSAGSGSDGGRPLCQSAALEDQAAPQESSAWASTVGRAELEVEVDSSDPDAFDGDGSAAASSVDPAGSAADRGKSLSRAILEWGLPRGADAPGAASSSSPADGPEAHVILARLSL